VQGSTAWQWVGSQTLSRRRDAAEVSRGNRVLVALLAAVATTTALGRLLGYKFGPNLVVRCRKGHLYTTVWIPGVHLTSVDLGVVRWQYCPVGRHWSWAVPVREATLSEEERRHARQHHDVAIP
jgi:hypothetical protein